jgi:hypothetical protein
VTPTAKGQTVTARCVKRCRKGRVASAKAKRGKTLLGVTRTGSRKGSTIEVRVAAKGQTTRYRRYTVLSKYPLLKATVGGCLLPKRLTATC